MTNIIFSKVVGTTFREDSREIIEKLKEGDELILVREPENKHDCNAIKVVVGVGSKMLGYIKRELAESLAVAMDSGVKYKCFVASITGGGLNTNYGVNIRIEKEKEEEVHSAVLKFKVSSVSFAEMKKTVNKIVLFVEGISKGQHEGLKMGKKSLVPESLYVNISAEISEWGDKCVVTKK